MGLLLPVFSRLLRERSAKQSDNELRLSNVGPSMAWMTVRLAMIPRSYIDTLTINAGCIYQLLKVTVHKELC